MNATSDAPSGRSRLGVNPRSARLRAAGGIAGALIAMTVFLSVNIPPQRFGQATQ